MSKISNYHKSVLLKEAIGSLNVKKGKKYIDATFGGGGHAGEIIEQGGVVLGIDFDGDAIENAKKDFNKLISESRLYLTKGNFKNVDEIARENGFPKVSGIIFDLGLSSHQIDESQRGFSYLRDGPLDMRMDRDLSVTAADLLKVLTKGELYEIFVKLGEETNAHAISNGIVSARRVKNIETTKDLMAILKKEYKVKGDSDFMNAKIGKKVFQALRIVVNDELENLRLGLPKAFDLLEKNGRVAVITFHSLEDRIVKKTFVDFERVGKGINIFKKPVYPSFLEVNQNTRSKSAKLRVIEKI